MDPGTWTYDQAIRYLNSRTNYEKKAPSYGPVTYDLRRMERLSRLLGNPERRYPVVHITGTKGKGSVASMVESCVRETGLRVGLFTSPHLVDLRERIALEGKPIPERDFARTLERVSRAVEHMRAIGTPPHPTFFEVMTAMAFEYFAEREADLAVFEVGMGGRLDSTNVVTPEVSVITRIGLDHVKQLGSTEAQIAVEKAGIVKRGVPVVTARQVESAQEVIERTAGELRSPVLAYGREIEVTEATWEPGSRAWRLGVRTPMHEHRDLVLPLLGRHQLENCALAVGVLDVLGARGILPTGEEWMKRGLEKVVMPARLQWIAGKPGLLLDGAHNPISIGALTQTVKEYVPHRRCHLVFAMAGDKDVEKALEILMPIADEVYFTLTNSPRATPPEELFEMAGRYGRAGMHVEPDPVKALAAARSAAGPQDLVLVTGSLYLVGDLLPSLRWE